MRITRRNWLAAVGIGLGLVMPFAVARAEGDDLRSLTAQWWQWAGSFPLSQNPITDLTGERCGLGQRGSIWFLAGTAGGSAVRNCLVPEGAELFFPVANIMFFDTPNVCGQGPESIPVRDMRAALAGAIDGVTNLVVEVDGRPVGRVQRVQSRVFAVALPEDNFFDAPCAAVGGQPRGIFSPAVDDGYYADLRPLPVGEHTLHFHAEVPDQGFVVDTTYHLTVVPVSPRAR